MFFSDKFQQSYVLTVSLRQFIDDFWTFATETSAWFDGLENCGCPGSSFAIDFSFVLQRLISMVQTVQHFIVFHQLQFVARWSMSLLEIWKCRKLRKFRSCSSSWSLTLPS